METKSLLAYRNNLFSQNGEDGIIEYIFAKAGTSSKICCEFGAWDGMHLSNTRKLILEGWTGILIEGDKVKYKSLIETYKDNNSVICINRWVDDKNNSLLAISRELGLTNIFEGCDFMSIDIDGLDFYIFAGIDIYPRLICVEVNAGHYPTDSNGVEREIAKNNVGQPLGLFTSVAKEKGYSLICYTGNAFYLRNDVLRVCGIPAISDEEAYNDFLNSLSVQAREWLYLVNIGIVNPYHKFENLLLNKENLGIGVLRSSFLFLRSLLSLCYFKIKKFMLTAHNLILNFRKIEND